MVVVARALGDLGTVSAELISIPKKCRLEMAEFQQSVKNSGEDFSAKSAGLVEFDEIIQFIPQK